MFYDIDLVIKDVEADIRTVVIVRLEVNQAPSGLYIASNPMAPSFIAPGKTPRCAILEYIGDMLYRTTFEAEMAG